MHSRGWQERKLQGGLNLRKRRAKGCGSCPGCVRDDCGQCRNCQDKVKFGGPGTKKQRCMLRTCSNMQRKMQRQESVVEEKDLTSVRITCVFCGRKRKKGLSRSALFCTKHCQTSWQDSHPGETPSAVSPQVSDCDESLTAQLLKEAYSPEPNITAKPTNSGFYIEENTDEEQLCAWKKSHSVLDGNSLDDLPSLNCSVTLSPSPTPLSSPTIYTPPATTMSQEHIDKWKEIARKLSFQSELRVVWNELKLRGGFSTNEHFIKHLLYHEAKRQCVDYDILCEKEPFSGSEVTQPDNSDETNVFSIQQCENTMQTASTCRDAHVCEHYLDSEGNNNDDTQSQQLQEETHALVSPPLQKMLHETCTTDEKEYQAHIQLYAVPDNCKKQCVLTVLESQMQCSTDEPDLEVCLDEVINSM